MTIRNINGILLLYHHYLKANAPTIMEYVNAFPRHTRFPIWTLNTELGFPKELENLRFSAVIFHYALFGMWPYKFNRKFENYIARDQSSFKVAIFQDEYHYCQPRFKFVNTSGIDLIYSCYDPKYYDQIYYKYTQVPKVVPALTGYVSEEMIDLGQRLTVPFEQRSIDISYRGRDLPFHMGRGSQEKTEIARGFLARSQNLDLKLDIQIGEDNRIYGENWYRFLANSKAVLGVESGVSLSDFEDVIRLPVEEAVRKNPNLTFEEVYEKYLKPLDEKIPVRTISPRHFEAAALRVCQVLFEGEYAGVLQPMRHYIPLKKDFSNFDQVITLLKDQDFCHQMVETAYKELIASGRYSFKQFIKEFDDRLLESGARLEPAQPGQPDEVTTLFKADLPLRKRQWALHQAIHRIYQPLGKLPGYRHIKPYLKKVLPWRLNPWN
ncbi:MAG: hypothetical protein IT308_05100 [Anaerolineaceae bacterium]|nr:hypothetical protein [Anaerolineaceae bacterium]